MIDVLAAQGGFDGFERVVDQPRFQIAQHTHRRSEMREYFRSDGLRADEQNRDALAPAVAVAKRLGAEILDDRHRKADTHAKKGPLAPRLLDIKCRRADRRRDRKAEEQQGLGASRGARVMQARMREGRGRRERGDGDERKFFENAHSPSYSATSVGLRLS